MAQPMSVDELEKKEVCEDKPSRTLIINIMAKVFNSY